MAEEPTQEKTVLPPENVDAAFRPYYALLVDRAIAELRAGRSDIELRVELQKITPSKAVLEAGFDTEEFITEAIRFAKSVFAPKISPEGIRIEPIIEKLGAPSPPKASDLFDMLKKLKERERLIRTAGFESQRAALRTSLEEITQRLSSLKIPVKQAGAFPFELATAQAAGLTLPSAPQPEGLVAEGEYRVTIRDPLSKREQVLPTTFIFDRISEREGKRIFIFKGFFGIPVTWSEDEFVRAEVVRLPPTFEGISQAIKPASAVLPTSSIATSSLVTAPSIPVSPPPSAGEESLTLPAGTEETRKAVEAKIAEGFVLSKVVSNPDGTATFTFTRVAAQLPTAAPSVAQPSPILTSTPAAIPTGVTEGEIPLTVETVRIVSPTDDEVSFPLGPPNGAPAVYILKLVNPTAQEVPVDRVSSVIFPHRGGDEVGANTSFPPSVPANSFKEMRMFFTIPSGNGWGGQVRVVSRGILKKFNIGVR